MEILNYLKDLICYILVLSQSLLVKNILFLRGFSVELASTSGFVCRLLPMKIPRANKIATRTTTEMETNREIIRISLFLSA